jgi:hypothetical protein
VHQRRYLPHLPGGELPHQRLAATLVERFDRNVAGTIDQDDLVSLAGSIGFQAPSERRTDQVVVVRNEQGDERRTRLPYVKLPRNPNLGE